MAELVSCFGIKLTIDEAAVLGEERHHLSVVIRKSGFERDGVYIQTEESEYWESNIRLRRLSLSVRST